MDQKCPTNDLCRKARNLRWLFFVIAGLFATIAVVSFVFEDAGSLALKLITAGVLLSSTVAWCSIGCIGWKGFTTRRVATILVAVNFLSLMAWNQGRRLQRQERWMKIYHEVGAPSAQPLAIGEFGSFLSRTLRSGSLEIGVTAIWVLNILTLMYLAQSEADKESARIEDSDGSHG